MSFADRYMTSIANAYDQAELTSQTLDGRIMAERCKLYAGLGAMGNGVNPNPIVGMMDMALMVTITADLSVQPWARNTFGRDNADAITSVLQVEEINIWNIVADYLTPDQIGQLHDLAKQWVADHPGQRFVTSARLAEFVQHKTGANNNLNVAKLASGVFSLINIDPFKGLDPAVVQVEQSRVLAERAFFYLQHMPLLLSWQTDLLYSQMLANPQTQQLLQNTTVIAGSTTRFTDSTSEFSGATSRFADTVEHFRRQLPGQETELVNQVGQIVATQRQAALEQASTQVSAITDAAVSQLGSTVNTQQDLLAANLQGVMNSSIDRLYARLRSLVLLTAGAFVAAVVLYRLIASIFFKTSRR